MYCLGDTGIMREATANPTIARRRRFRFGMKTLLVVLTVSGFAAYLATVLIVVRGRARVDRDYPIQAIYTNPGEIAQPPLVWRMLGAKAVSVLTLFSTATETEVAKVKSLFPEAHVSVMPSDLFSD